MSPVSETAARIVENIRRSGLSIYDEIKVGDPNLWLPAPELEGLLDAALRGFNPGDLPIKTRSKVLKQQVCAALGYPSPESFKRVQPRFPGQNFDTYGQKANNLQVWNESLSPTRRYVLMGIDGDNCIYRVKVASGDTLAKLDRTGTLTQKYQARFDPGTEPTELVSADDTSRLLPFVAAKAPASFRVSPNALPDSTSLLSIGSIFTRLSPLIGKKISLVGSDQERNRGAELHRLVVDALGYQVYADGGDFPDVRHQLLEVKLQTATTVDLGLVKPSSTDLLDIRQLDGQQVRHCDVRYAVFFGKVEGDKVRLTHLVVSTGEKFFNRFVQFGGKVLNKKQQIRLPNDFFTT